MHALQMEGTLPPLAHMVIKDHQVYLELCSLRELLADLETEVKSYVYDFTEFTLEILK